MIGKTLGHYRVGEQLGRGGMGEVYVADDLNLNRKVALKFLPDAFIGDPERMTRFEREAKLLASLNHPNIAAIYGLEQAEGKRFLVLELVEGETLAQRISKGALPVDEALTICRQIAEGLEAAHEKGVIHRDLKPANVMITEGDKVKILDFGLAKALSDETRSVDSSQSPTLTEAMTRPGVILGTAAYMSPEQAKGKSVDKRADIWAFGCILYECLAGKRNFEGETVTETLAAILRGEPDWSQLPASTPPNIRLVLRRCLEKNASRRFHHAADLSILMEEPLTPSGASETDPGKIPRALVAGLVVAALLIGWALAYLWHRSKGDSVTGVTPTITHIAAPPGTISAFCKGFALAPDGQTLVFSARTSDGKWQLWKRRLDDPHALPMAGTENGTHPFWSPDGRNVAFIVPGELRRVPSEGGQVQTICALGGLFPYGTWSDSNEIIFSAYRGTIRTLFHVSADGGVPMEVKGFGNEDVIRPQWLPGSRLFLYSRSDGDHSAHIYAASIDGSLPPKQVAPLDIHSENIGSGFFFSAPGRIFFNHAGAVCVQRFDPESLSVIGKAVPLAGLAGNPLNWFALSAAGHKMGMLARESASDTGNPGDPVTRLKWLNRKGEILGDLGPQGRYWTLRLSPDGSRAAVNPDADIWILDAGNRLTRVTSRKCVEFSTVWSPDGARIAFTCDPGMLLVRPAGAGGTDTELPNTGKRVLHPTDWSRDGRYLLLVSQATRESASADIWLYDFKEQSAKPWLATKFEEGRARFSPQGDWVAYSSSANGPTEVYLRPFKGEGSAVLVSSSGGNNPAWRGDGRELFYLSPRDELMAVPVNKLGTVPEVGEPRRLFQVAMNDITGGGQPPYDVTPDGQRFLVNLPERPEPLLFIQGVDELLKKGQ